jgi:hypothetical protein
MSNVIPKAFDLLTKPFQGNNNAFTNAFRTNNETLPQKGFRMNPEINLQFQRMELNKQMLGIFLYNQTLTRLFTNYIC